MVIKLTRIVVVFPLALRVRTRNYSNNFLYMQEKSKKKCKKHIKSLFSILTIRFFSQICVSLHKILIFVYMAVVIYDKNTGSQLGEFSTVFNAQSWINKHYKLRNIGIIVRI